MNDLLALRKKIVRYRRLADFACDPRTGQTIAAFVAELEVQADQMALEAKNQHSGTEASVQAA